MVRTLNKSTFVLKNKLHLSIRDNMLRKMFRIFFVVAEKICSDSESRDTSTQ